MPASFEELIREAARLHKTGIQDSEAKFRTIIGENGQTTIQGSRMRYLIGSKN
jgi:hypothetical protein